MRNDSPLRAFIHCDRRGRAQWKEGGEAGFLSWVASAAASPEGADDLAFAAGDAQSLEEHPANTELVEHLVESLHAAVERQSDALQLYFH